MSQGIRITCRSEAEIPHPDSLAERSSREQWIVLEFPQEPGHPSPVGDKSGLIDALAERLPEDFKVFDAGGDAANTWITVKRVIPRSEVLAHEDELVHAARTFRRVATERMQALAEHLRVPLSQFWTEFGPWRPEGMPEEGSLPDGWKFYFHGFECCFGRPGTGQKVEVLLGFAEEFGVLDPYFFAGFAASTLELEPVSRLFRDTFHDPERALNVLEERGRLQRIERSLGPGWGLVARD